MNINTNDPRLTAYALGELDDAERTEIETLLNNSPDARTAVDQIRQTAGHLTHELAAEPSAMLTATQRDTIASAARDPSEIVRTANTRPVKLRMHLYAPLAFAASLLLFASLLAIPSLQRARTGAPKQLTPNSAGVNASSQPALVWEFNAWTDASILRPSDALNSAGSTNRDGVAGDTPHAMYLARAATIVAGVPNDTLPANSVFEFPDRPELAYGYRLPSRASEERAFLSATSADGITRRQLQALGYLAAGSASSEDQSRLRLFFDEHPGLERQLEVIANSDPRERFYSSDHGLPIADLARLRLMFDEAGASKDRLFVPAGYAPAGTSGDEDGDGALEVEYSYLKRMLRELKAERRQRLSGRFEPTNTESYTPITHNPFLPVADNPLSTFSIDVDTASYANVRRFLNSDQLPPPDAVRIEEMINYFDYDYPPPTGDDPFSVNVDIAACPWAPTHRLMRVGLKGLVFDEGERPLCNLVFLIDVSGSMQPSNKLPLLQQALTMLTAELYDDDRVAIVVYAGSSGLVLPSTHAADQNAILQALANLQAGGSTNGGEGIQLAYDIAADNFIEGGVNRVILATDGDFNVGITNQNDLTTLIEDKARTGVFLSVLGFGMGNYKDSTLETLADKGNGNYAYIDTSAEARKVLVDQIGGTLVTIAKDVKLQIEFNPAQVAAYRLIGYENRVLAARDFNDDTKDAGEIGAGHTVTALYEIVPAGLESELADLLDRAASREADRAALREADRRAAANDEIPPADEYGPPASPTPIARSDAFEQVVRDPQVDPLKYQSLVNLAAAAVGLPDDELATIKLRYKQPDGEVSKLIEIAIIDDGRTLADTSPDFRFAASVASFGMLLRHSSHIEGWTHEAVLELATESAAADDPHGYRAEFIELVERALSLRDR